MYTELWKDAYELTQERKAEVILAAAHRLLAKEGGEPEIVLAAAILSTVPREQRHELLQRHVNHELHGEVVGILEQDPGNRNAAIVHDAILLAEFSKPSWNKDINSLQVLLKNFKTVSGKKEGQHYYSERAYDTKEALRPGAQRINTTESIKTPEEQDENMVNQGPHKKHEKTEKPEETVYHWADQTARKIITERSKDSYTVAAGITPSGVVHFGNFREIISQHLVALALEHAGKKVRFVYSWDDYDTFRKVPKNLPDQEGFKKYLFQPNVDVPDPFECKHANYAEHFKAEITEDLPLVGIFPEFIHQHKKYRACEYAEDIREALIKREEIKKILNDFKTEELSENWWPLNVYCQQCNRDRTVTIQHFDGQYGVTYACECGYSNTFDIRKTGIAKLSWRVDWPMRWRKEKVDFESAGKDHASAGGSFDSGKVLVEKIFNYPMIEYFMYEFVSAKGNQGKMSSSQGNTITLRTVLQIYTPELVRFLFASTRPNASFNVSFDTDIFKIYEDFDKVERIYFKQEEANEKDYQNAKRVYELSILAPPLVMPVQPSFRHLTNYVQIAEGDMDKVVAMLQHEIKIPVDEARVRNRGLCAWQWTQKYAADQYKFTLQEKPYSVKIDEPVRLALRELGNVLAAQDEEELAELFYQICEQHGIANTEFFKYAYLTLIGKERGPKLANIITQAGHERIATVLKQL